MLSLFRETWRPYAACLATDRAVAALDPLGADRFFRARLPRLNAQGDSDLILGEFLPFLPPASALMRLNRLEAMAVTRDIGLVASSLVRWGMMRFEPLETVLLALSSATNEVPADTVFSYGPRNPRADRRRSFTGTPEEYAFIDAFSGAMAHLTRAVACLDAAQDVPLADPRHAVLVRRAGSRFSAMTAAILEVRRRISAEFFTSVMRPYFEPKVVGGRKYLAAGGAQMPVILIDLLLWGADRADSSYVRYWTENVEYHPEPLRRRVRKILDGGSLVAKAEGAVAASGNGGPAERNALRASLQAQLEVLTHLEKFRYPHLRVAEANMKIRKAGAVGSGGYDTMILRFLIEQGLKAAQAVRGLAAKLGGSNGEE